MKNAINMFYEIKENKKEGETGFSTALKNRDLIWSQKITELHKYKQTNDQEIDISTKFKAVFAYVGLEDTYRMKICSMQTYKSHILFVPWTLSLSFLFSWTI